MAGAVDMLVMACDDERCDFKPVNMQRRPVGDDDILIDMRFCGVCHTDLHVAANHFKAAGNPTQYPCVPGHELAGVCVQVGAQVTKFKVGDHIGVGCIADSCMTCAECGSGQEQKCKNGMVWLHNSTDKHGRAATYPVGQHTVGGYCSKMVIHERFAILVPKSYPLEYAGPVMCSGVTMYGPLKFHKMTEGSHVGIVGLGGLGLMGIKLAKALGCKVTAISRGTAKKPLAISTGADCYVASSSAAEMAAAAGSLDLLLDTIPSGHDEAPYERLLTPAGKIVVLGVTPSWGAAGLLEGLVGEKALYNKGFIGGIAATQDVINLCDKAKIYPSVELRPVQDLNEIFEKLDKSNDSGVRYVLDLANSLTQREVVAARCLAPAPRIHAPEAPVSTRSVLSRFLKMVVQHYTHQACGRRRS